MIHSQTTILSAVEVRIETHTDAHGKWMVIKVTNEAQEEAHLRILSAPHCIFTNVPETLPDNTELTTQ